MIKYWSLPISTFIFATCFSFFLFATPPHVTWNLNGDKLNTEGSQATHAPVQIVAKRFSFQARISQAQLPIFEGYFPELTVYYGQGGFNCEEKFENVRVLDSVVNLVLGEQARCSFQQLLDQSTLNIKLCTSDTSCFDVDRYSMGSVASAVKVNQAHQAEIAYLVNRSFISDYVYPQVRSLNQRDSSFIWAPSFNYLSSDWDQAAPNPLISQQQLNSMQTKGFMTWNHGTLQNHSCPIAQLL